MDPLKRVLTREVSRIDLQEGELYAQHYDQRKELGRGKFGVVFHVKDRKTDRCYAAKHIRIRKAEQKEKVSKIQKYTKIQKS